MSLKIGEKAPSFTLVDTQKKAVRLEDYKGKKLLVLFFPLAFTSVCTEELCAVRDGISHYAAIDKDVVAISVDSIFALEKFKKENKLNFTLLSDFNKEASQAYFAYYPDYYGMKGVSKRAAFVLDEDGYIKYAEVMESDGELPDFEAINSALED